MNNTGRFDFLDQVARVGAKCPAVYRDGPLRWYWVEVVEKLDAPPLAGCWVLAGTRADAWHEVMHELPAGYWDATAEEELSADERTRVGSPPTSGNRSQVVDFVAPCAIVDCQGK